MSDFYQELCNMLIRPTRQLYHLYDLGNPIISTFGKREDFQILVKQRKKLQCSFYRNAFLNDANASTLPCVIYLHSLNGSRLEFLANIEPLMKMGFTIGTLDFAGCGLSDGQYVTLGAHQKVDVLQLIKYIHRTYKQQKFLIWGRSMGAVASIKFYSLLQDNKMQSRELRELQILGLVLDSPFWSLDQLAVQIAKNRINIPEIVLKMAFYMIQGSIQSKANFKTCELELEKDVKKIRCPTMIITSKNDTLVPCEHSQAIYQNIPSQDKKLVYIESQHNSNREKRDVQKIYAFLEEKAKFCVQQKPKNSFLAGRIQNKLEQIKAKQGKKRQNLTLSKEKVSNPPKKNPIFSSNNTNYYSSNNKQQNHLVIQDFAQNSTQKVSIKRFSFGKNLIPEESFANQMNESYNRNQTLNNSTDKKIYSSADCQRVMFAKQIIQNSVGNYCSLQKQTQNPSEFDSIHLNFQPQRNLKEKNTKQSSSYKNIQCLKTVKKIKRLQPSTQNDCKELVQRQEVLKNHMNVITAKLKKKTKNIMTKSFLPLQSMEGKQVQYKSEKTLRKQQTVKSARNLQSSNGNRTEMIHSLKNKSLNESPCIQSCASNREMKIQQEPQRPLTAQVFQLNSSMRRNGVGPRAQSSKQGVQRMYSLYHITENIKGIKPTLNSKFSFNTKDNTKEKQFLSQSIGDGHEVIKPEFMYSKNVLSQAMSMRNENKISIHLKINTSNSKIPIEKV